jgi:hypothetical protein
MNSGYPSTCRGKFKHRSATSAVEYVSSSKAQLTVLNSEGARDRRLIRTRVRLYYINNSCLNFSFIIETPNNRNM